MLIFMIVKYIVIDKQNKNPSRLSRMPGVVRHGTKRQALIATNIGASDYLAWVDWLNDKSDDLPLMDNLDDMIKNPPPLAPELISGVLRKGHKLLLAGPSKAGKSFMLMNLAICIAEGRPFLGLQCMQGKVLYINMEIDKATCIHRFADIYKLNEMECFEYRHMEPEGQSRTDGRTGSEADTQSCQKRLHRHHFGSIVQGHYR